jgi:hypothetical protein
MSSSSAIRDPLQDHLLTPQNAALVIIACCLASSPSTAAR